MIGFGIGIIGGSVIVESTVPNWAIGADTWRDFTIPSGPLSLPLGLDADHPYGTGFGTQLAVGITGFYQCFINAVSAVGTNGRLVAFSDGTGTNRDIVLSLDGVYGIAGAGGTVSTVDPVVASRVVTVVFGMGNLYQKIELIGGTPASNNGLAFPTGMNMIGINTNGWENTQNMNASPSRIALKFGIANDASFAAMRTKALLVS